MPPRQIQVNREPCLAVRAVLDRVGDKWSVLLVSLLGDGSMRFNELRRSIEGISQRMLTLTLRALERDGLVNRTVYPTIPPRGGLRADRAGTDPPRPSARAGSLGGEAPHRGSASPRAVRQETRAAEEGTHRGGLKFHARAGGVMTAVHPRYDWRPDDGQ